MTRRTVLAVMLLLAVAVLVSAGIDSEAQTTPATGTGSGTQETTIKIDDDTVLVARGNCGSEAGAASWTYSRSSSTSSLSREGGVLLDDILCKSG